MDAQAALARSSTLLGHHATPERLPSSPTAQTYSNSPTAKRKWRAMEADSSTDGRAKIGRLSATAVELNQTGSSLEHKDSLPATKNLPERVPSRDRGVLTEAKSAQRSPTVLRIADSEAFTGNTFAIRICQCEQYHSCWRTLLPIKAVRTYEDLAERLRRLLAHDWNDEGVFTDREGNEFIDLPDMFPLLLEGGLRELTWHPDCRNGGSLSRAEAQEYIQTCLIMKTTGGKMPHNKFGRKEGPRTPCAHRVTLSPSSSSSLAPYTAEMSSEGEILQLTNLKNRIVNVKLANLFDSEVVD